MPRTVVLQDEEEGGEIRWGFFCFSQNVKIHTQNGT